MAKTNRIVNTRGCVASIYSSKNKFWIGDPGYVVDTECWKEWGESTDWSGSGAAIVHNHAVMLIDSTAHGDGVYSGDYDGDELTLPVDSGCLGVVPAELVALVDDDDHGEYISVLPGTPMKMYSYGDFDLHPGQFLFEWTAPTGDKKSLTIKT